MGVEREAFNDSKILGGEGTRLAPEPPIHPPTHLRVRGQLALWLPIKQARAGAVALRLPPRIVVQQHHGGARGQRQQLADQRLVGLAPVGGVGRRALVCGELNNHQVGHRREGRCGGAALLPAALLAR